MISASEKEPIADEEAESPAEPEEAPELAEPTEGADNVPEEETAPPAGEQESDEETEPVPDAATDAIFSDVINGLPAKQKECLWSCILGQLSVRGRDLSVRAHSIYTYLIEATFPGDTSKHEQVRARLRTVSAEAHQTFLSTVHGIQSQANRTANVRLSGVVDAFEKLFDG